MAVLSLSLLLCTSAFAQPNPAARGNSARTSETTLGEVYDIIPHMRVKGQPVNEKLIEISNEPVRLSGRSTKFKVAPKSTVTTENLIGDVIYPSPVGAAKINLNGNYNIFAPDGQNCQWTTMGVKDGKLIGFYWEKAGQTQIAAAYYREVDLESGEEVVLTNMTGSFATYIQGGCYVAEENAFYGFSNSGWVKYDVATATSTVLNANLVLKDNVLSQYTYNIKSGKIIGINSVSGTIYEVGKETGEITAIKTDESLKSKYVGGFAYDITSLSYLYNPNDIDYSYIVSIDADTYAVTKVCDVANVAEFGVFYVNETVALDPMAPKPAQFVSANFVDNSLKGTVAFRMPVKLNDSVSTPISTQVDYVFSINGMEIKRGSAEPGSTVTFNVETGTVNGDNDFTMVCSLGDHVGKACSQIVYIGNDVPSAPENVKLTAATVSWSPVTTGAHNAYLDVAKVTYTVEVNGNVVARNLTTTSCPSYLPANAELSEYVATVYAVCNGLTSEGGKSNGLMFGSAMNLPVDLAPTALESTAFKIIDNNKDNSTWVYYTKAETSSSPGINAFRYKYNSSNPGDDYLVLPPVQIDDASLMYNFTMEAWAESATYPESLEVYIGTSATASAFKQIIIPNTTVKGSNNNRTTLSGSFTVDNPGIHFVAVKATSPKDLYYLYADKFRISASTLLKHGPVAVSGAKAVPGSEGALNATVSFTMPSKTSMGEDITDNVTATVKSMVDQKTVTASPGSEVSVTLNTVQGENELEIVPETGGYNGEPLLLAVWCGIDIPVAVTNLACTMDENNYSGTLTWERPTVGEHDGYLPESGYKYTLYQQELLMGILPMWVPVEGAEIATDVCSCSFDFSALAPSPLQSKILGIGVSNSAGESESVSQISPLIGDPYEIPAYETFVSDKEFNYSPIYFNNDPDNNGSRCTLQIMKPAGNYADPDGNYALRMYCSSKTYGEIELPKFSTKGMNKVAFIPTIYNGSCEDVVFKAISSEGEEELFSLKGLTGLPDGQYISPVIDLPAKFQDKGWIQIKVYPYFASGMTQFFMTHYALKNMVPEDVNIAVGGTTTGFVGEVSKFQAAATSIGTGDARFSGVKFSAKNAAGDILFEQVVNKDTTILTGETVVVETEFTPAFDNIGTYTVTAELLNTDDVVMNNTATMSYAIKKGKAILVEDLKGEISDNVINLTWTAPVLSNGYESFENDIPFEVNDGNIGEFTQKNDGKNAYTWQTQPDCIKNVAGKPGFHVYAGDALNGTFGNGAFDAYDGNQFAMIFCPDDKSAADSWLISPSVKSGSDASFYTRAITDEYGDEVIQICYSTVDNDSVENFVVLDNVEVGEDWQEVKFTLPADAKRFAIHYISQDVFGLLVDAIKYVPVSEGVLITGYDIYRATGATEADCTTFEKIGTSAPTTYTDATADVEKYNKYYVIPKLSDGSFGLEGNKATVDPKNSGVNGISAVKGIAGSNGYVSVVGYEGEAVMVASADGKVYFNAIAGNDEKVFVPTGIYAVKAGKTVAKVVVK